MAALGGNETYLEELRLCDWERSVANCKDPDFIKTTLIVCAILHLFVGAYGIWVLWYRNGGFKASIVTNLYFMQLNNIRPRPVSDCTSASRKWMNYNLVKHGWIADTVFLTSSVHPPRFLR